MSGVLHPAGVLGFTIRQEPVDMQMYIPLTNAADPEKPLLFSLLVNMEPGPRARLKDTSINIAFLKV